MGFLTLMTLFFMNPMNLYLNRVTLTWGIMNSISRKWLWRFSREGRQSLEYFNKNHMFVRFPEQAIKEFDMEDGNWNVSHLSWTFWFKCIWGVLSISLKLMLLENWNGFGWQVLILVRWTQTWHSGQDFWGAEHGFGSSSRIDHWCHG